MVIETLFKINTIKNMCIISLFKAEKTFTILKVIGYKSRLKSCINK
jgi:hypothetical protein